MPCIDTSQPKAAGFIGLDPAVGYQSTFWQQQHTLPLSQVQPAHSLPEKDINIDSMAFKKEGITKAFTGRVYTNCNLQS